MLLKGFSAGWGAGADSSCCSSLLFLRCGCAAFEVVEFVRGRRDVHAGTVRLVGMDGCVRVKRESEAGRSSHSPMAREPIVVRVVSESRYFMWCDGW
jgi:hypothetical protein